jgi:hypothetical protein
VKREVDESWAQLANPKHQLRHKQACSQTTMTIPFKLAVSEAQLVDLKTRLSLVHLPDELEEAGWDYGTPLADIKRLVEHWRNGYDWRAAEKHINYVNFSSVLTV